MLQGKTIEEHFVEFPDNPTAGYDVWQIESYECVMSILFKYPSDLRVAPNQDEAVRLYGIIKQTGERDFIGFQFTAYRSINKETAKPVSGYDTHYIDISPSGFIVGGKIEATT